MLRRIQREQLKTLWSVKFFGLSSTQATRNLSLLVGESENVTKGQHADETDEFTKEFLKHRIQLTNVQKVLMGFGSSIASLIDPHRHDMIAALGETGDYALQNTLRLMKNSTENKYNTYDELRQLPGNTLGRIYVNVNNDKG